MMNSPLGEEHQADGGSHRQVQIEVMDHGDWSGQRESPSTWACLYGMLSWQ